MKFKSRFLWWKRLNFYLLFSFATFRIPMICFVLNWLVFDNLTAMWMNPDTSRSFFFFLVFLFVRFKEWDVYVKGVIVDSSVIINLLKPLWLIIRALFKFFNWCLTNFENKLRIIESKYWNFNHTVKFAIKMQTLQRHRFRRSSVIMKGHVA